MLYSHLGAISTYDIIENVLKVANHIHSFTRRTLIEFKHRTIEIKKVVSSPQKYIITRHLYTTSFSHIAASYSRLTTVH